MMLVEYEVDHACCSSQCDHDVTMKNMKTVNTLEDAIKCMYDATMHHFMFEYNETTLEQFTQYITRHAPDGVAIFTSSCRNCFSAFVYGKQDEINHLSLFDLPECNLFIKG